MNTLKGIHITYIGDWVFYTGPCFIESPFEMMAKDCHLDFLGKPVTDAFEAQGATVEAFSNWQLYRMAPKDYQALIDRSDLIVVSDVEARCFHLDPTFFDQSVYGKRIITFPDRLKRLTHAVEAGKGLIFMGGWLGFSGYLEKGGWRRAPIADWLPFTCLAGDDLMESSEGFQVEVADASHPMFKGLPVNRMPPLLGYNEFIARDNMKVLWRVAKTHHPLLGVSEHGKGRMVTFGSDPVPHWGINLMLWKGYARLWQNMAAWCVRR
jgi:uncharacterized membrane protein